MHWLRSNLGDDSTWTMVNQDRFPFGRLFDLQRGGTTEGGALLVNAAALQISAAQHSHITVEYVADEAVPPLSVDSSAASALALDSPR